MQDPGAVTSATLGRRGDAHWARARGSLALGRHAEALDAVRRARRYRSAVEGPLLALAEGDALLGLQRYREVVGVATRALGRSGLEPDFKVISTGIGFVNIFGDTFTFEEHRAAAQEGLELARQAMHSGEWDLIILDEILGAVSQKQVDLEQVLSLIAEKPHTLDICLTGHDAEKEFIDQILAVTDLATEMVKLKHPFDTGHQARKGIDY